jgi:hypothetical protein
MYYKSTNIHGYSNVTPSKVEIRARDGRIWLSLRRTAALHYLQILITTHDKITCPVISLDLIALWYTENEILYLQDEFWSKPPWNVKVT